METMDTADLRAVLRGDDVTARSFIRLVSHPADLVEALRALEFEEWPRLLDLIEDEEARAEVVALLDEDERDDLFEHLKPKQIGQLVVDLESDDAADIIGELEPEEQKVALAQLPVEDRKVVEELLAYPDDSAGGIMQVELAKVPSSATVADTTQHIRALAEEGIEIHRVYVVDEEDRLMGTVDLVDLVLNSPHKKIAELTEEPIATVTPDVDQEEVADIFRKYGIVVLPVVDDEDRLLGRIVVDDIVDVLHEEAEEDALRMAGTDVGELLYRDQASRIAMVRLPWIGINLFGSLISAFLLPLYEPVLEQAVIIASFIPVITAMGGNVGTQSATILTRGLATGRVSFADLPRTLFREFRVGLLMGTICGISVGVIAALLFGNGRIYLGIVVALAMVSAMTAAAVVGATAPAAMERYGVDPAIASGPFVTTANDIVGIVIYMSTALLFLERLA